jgi:BMFP domain-containing protein YqiC
MGGRTVVSDVRRVMEAAIGKLGDLVRAEVRSQLKQVGLASRDEVDALRKRVRQLEKAQGVPRKAAAKRSAAGRSVDRVSRDGSESASASAP